MVDQVIDEYQDATGIDAGNSTNELASGSGTAKYYEGGTSSTPSITHDADASGTDGDYSWYKWTDTAATGSYSSDTAQDHQWLVVAGGGGAGYAQSSQEVGSGGGAGGFRTGSTLSLVGSTTYTITVGSGGIAGTYSVNGGNGGDSSITGSDIANIVSSGGGGGIKYEESSAISAGGSGGGGSSYDDGGAVIGITQLTAHGEVGTVQGFVGGGDAPSSTSSGGGGASEAGSTGTSDGGDGGDGENNVMGMDDSDSDAFLTTASAGHDVGGTRYFAGGGAGSTNSGSAGAGGKGGGGDGHASSNGVGSVGVANTGGGGGGGCAINSSSNGAIGGSGIVIIRRPTTVETSGANLTLQSTATTAESAPTTADLVVLIEDGAGTATVNSDIKGYVSRDGSAFSSAVTFVDEGDWGTNKRILVARNVDISGITSGTSMKYKLTTHNQVASSLETRIHATSLAWA
jgi:hypothetical protein